MLNTIFFLKMRTIYWLYWCLWKSEYDLFRFKSLYCCQKFGFQISMSVWNARSHTFYVPVVAVSEQRQPNIGFRNNLKINKFFSAFLIFIVSVPHLPV